MVLARQKSFHVREKLMPWAERTKNRWPLLNQLVQYEAFEFIDYLVAEKLLENYPDLTEEIVILFCHLSLASRKGHLCVKINEHEILPAPSELWVNSDENAEITPSQLLQKVREAVLHGTKKLPPNLVVDVTKMSREHFPSTPLCSFEDLYYFQKYWIYETRILEHLLKLLKHSPSIKIEGPVELEGLLPEQIQAIECALEASLTIISGGPGTGKTYTAGQLIGFFCQKLSLDDLKRYQIVLAAPTGKAASNLQKSLKNALKNTDIAQPIQTKTLHSLLGIKKNGSRTSEKGKILADLIVVDECSMIDVRMMGDLLEAIKPGARLILLGDHQQLPSIEAGSLFSELINLLKNDKYVHFLRKCLRIELKSILDLAEHVNQGRSLDVLESLKTGSEEIQYTAFNDSKNLHDIQLKLLARAKNRFLAWQASSWQNSEQSLLEKSGHFRILTSLRKGPLGVDELNNLFFHHLLKSAKKEVPFPVPIMLVQNESRLGLFNG